jgi:hypothetical protein
VGHDHSARRLRQLTGGPGRIVPGLNKSQINPNLIQIRSNLLLSKQDLLLPQKIEIKYGWKVFEIKNNYPYIDFLRLNMGFELKFRKLLCAQIKEYLIENSWGLGIW